VRLQLEDQGEGWFWDTPSIEVEVVTQAQSHSRPFYRVVFARPLELEEAGELPLSDARAAAYPGAWVSPRWVGHEVRRDEAISALLWLATGGQASDRPPRDVPQSARVACRELD
jgi:hypothetical protein